MGNQNQNANPSNFFLKTYRNWRYFIIVKNRPTVNTGSFFTLQFLLSSCGVHLQSSLSDFYIVGGAHHAAC
jgi:hypothetical protein